MLTLEIVLYSKKLVYCTMKINGYTIFHICVEVHMGRWYANLKQDNFNEKHYRPVRTWKLDGKQNRQTIWINNEKILYKGNIIFLFKDRKYITGVLRNMLLQFSVWMLLKHYVFLWTFSTQY